MNDESVLKMFGFIEGETRCEKCGELLTVDNAWWAFGKWWHKSVKDCDKRLLAAKEKP